MVFFDQPICQLITRRSIAIAPAPAYANMRFSDSRLLGRNANNASTR